MQPNNKLTQWVINKIKRDFPDDVALLIGINNVSVGGDGHGECFDYFVPATERGKALEQGIHIGGVNHDLYPRDWARCAQTAALEDRATHCLYYGEILYSRSSEDAARFEALRQQLKDNLANPALVYRKALERLDEAMNLYRNMMFEDSLHQVRMATGYVFHFLLEAVRYLNGTFYLFHQDSLPQLEQCAEKPEQLVSFYHAMLGATNSAELKSIAHLMILSMRNFIASYRPAAQEQAQNKNYAGLAAWYAELSLFWRRLRFYCEQGNADSAFAEACLLQDECNNIADEFDLPGMDILGLFDKGNLANLSEQATAIEQSIITYIKSMYELVPQYATFEEFAENNP